MLNGGSSASGRSTRPRAVTAKDELLALVPWVLVALAALAVVVDLIDGDHPKTLTSAGLLIGLMGLLGHRLTGASLWRWLAIVGFVVCIGSAVYRAALHQGWL